MLNGSQTRDLNQFDLIPCLTPAIYFVKLIGPKESTRKIHKNIFQKSINM